MSNLLNKSEFNNHSADLLISKNYYAPSVHCSYYSCLQKIYHILYSQLGKTEDSLKREMDLTRQGTHEFVISTIYSILKSKGGRIRDFNNEISVLKKMRVDADYRDKQISYTDGKAAFDKAKVIHQILKETFKV